MTERPRHDEHPERDTNIEKRDLPPDRITPPEPWPEPEFEEDEEPPTQ